ncbi:MULTISPECIES: dTDP-4-amino-4,6-dideoxygalactose transaminase [Luteimonas]|uniref:dTDP-4-amino-4,6-dideoxygalactose transaminase n=1 Tax=Luteimonas TaxID=83614 RepID=UPI000C7C7B8D|nr:MULTISPECIES: dTDP-4-amino-4,6-dideoxygalactose transaminase [Luteimonas]
MRIPFNKPYVGPNALEYIRTALESGHLSGDGPYTKKCHLWLEQSTGCRKALLTHSCTGALEMAAMLLDLAPGDEVIMPSFTFVSTANAFVLRGAVPVFVDIRPDTLNIDETLIEAAITSRTRAICVVHYAGVACEMDAIMAIAERHGLAVVEDAAQGVNAAYKGKPLGSIGHLGALSFHETKNVISGEGGALLVNRPDLVERAEIIREKGTDRSKFFRGQVDKYTWVDIGSSFLPGEVVAALLYSQLEEIEAITARRLASWQRFDDALAPFDSAGRLRRPTIPAHCTHNAHMYYLLLPSEASRDALIASMKAQGVASVFHYIPLHSSPAGTRYGRSHGGMEVTDATSRQLVRLPLWPGLDLANELDSVIAACHNALADPSC